MARHISELSNGADIEVRSQDVSNDTEDRSPRLSDLVPNRPATISASDRGQNEPNTSTLVSAIKQNLRAKLASTSERRASSEKVESYPMRRLGDLRTTKRSTRFDDESVRETQLGSQEGQSKESTQDLLFESTATKWKQFAQRSRAAARETMQVESYQFFVGCLEEEEVDHSELKGREEVATEESLEQEQQHQEEGEQDDTHSRDALIEELERADEQQPSSQENYGIVSAAAPSNQSTFWGSPYCLDTTEWVEREEKFLFSPSSQPVPLELKMPSDTEPRLKENEGFFVHERPKLSWRNYNQLEQRLLKQTNGRKWFGEDGLVEMAGDPRRPHALRPDMVETANNHSSRTDLVAFRNATHSVKGGEDLPDGDESVYKLAIIVGRMQFSHHHLFNLEHVLASKLISAHKHYMSKREQNRSRALREKLNALRSLRTTLESTESVGPDTRGNLHQCKKDIFVTLAEKKREEEMEFALFRDISSLWRDLKQMRTEQGYSSTSIKVLFKVEPCDLEKEKIERAQDVEDEVLYRREEHQRLMLEYRKALKEYDKKMRRLRRRQARLAGDQSSSEVNLIADEVPAPARPQDFSEALVREEVTRQYQETMPALERSKLVPLLEAAAVTNMEQCSRDEQRRRIDVGGLRYRIKILVNNKEATQSTERHLEPHDFIVRFKDNFTVKVRKWPTSLTLQVYELSNSGGRVLSEVYLPVPDGKEAVATANTLQQYQFTDCTTVTHLHNAVGSNVAVDDGRTLLTSGSIFVSASWECDDSGQLVCPPTLKPIVPPNASRTRIFPRYMSVTGPSDITALRNWIRESQLDPNDPENADLISLVNSIESTEAPQYFRLIDLDESARFVSDSTFENNRRFHLLEMRQKKHPGVKNKVLPSTNEEVTDRMWKSVVSFETEDPYKLPCAVFDNFRTSNKQERQEYISGIKDMVLKKVREASKEVNLSDMVYNELLPNVVTLKNAVTSFFSPRRPLQPKRKITREVKPSSVQITEASISVRVARAVNVPRRRNSQRNSRTGALSSMESLPFGDNFELDSVTPRLSSATTQPLQSDLPLVEIPVRSFVEVSFESSVARTATVTGVNPHWNEELLLTLTPPENDFSPVNLSRINSFLHFNLFDEVVVDILKDERQRSTNVHHRLERKWLGSFSIPFSSLHANSRFEGSVTIDVPPLLLGYSQGLVEGLTTFEREDHGISNDSQTSLQIFVSVDPPLPALPPIQHKFDSYESGKALLLADLWRKRLKDKFPKRHFQATALNAEGMNVIITRYISPQNPPEELLGEGDVASLALMQRLARFVSLIPNLPDSRFFSGTCDIWTTSDQFLKMLAGDEEEHAILLCNYFLHIRMASWVVLGNGIPEGSTAYVLSVHPTGAGYLLWNPCTGGCYHQYDSYCPLASVGCMFNSYNIWGNIQSYEDPGRISFDVQSNKQWMPLFKDDMPVLPSVQVEDLIYQESDMDRINYIEKQLDALIVNKIQMWRTERAQITRWNRHSTSVLKNALQKYEENMSSLVDLDDGGFEELQTLASTYKMNGFPIHAHYNTSDEILEKLKSTGIHLCEDERVEYARAVYVHTYPNDIISIWIYVATLMRE